MAQQLTVKAYLKRWNAERKQQEMVEEIRRFSVDEDVATSYTYLLAKVTNVFPALNNKSTTLYWRGSFFYFSEPILIRFTRFSLIILEYSIIRSQNHRIIYSVIFKFNLIKSGVGT